MVLASHSSPTSSFFVLPVILAKLFYCVALNPRGFHTFSQCLDLLITNPKSSFLPTAAGATAASPPGVSGGFCSDAAFFFFFLRAVNSGEKVHFWGAGVDAGAAHLVGKSWGCVQRTKLILQWCLGAAVSYE